MTLSELKAEGYVLGGAFEYLRLRGLEVFDRKEDAGEGRRVIVFGDKVCVLGDLSGNPSRRRDTVSLYFESENGDPVRIDLIQHKGQTLVSVEDWNGLPPAELANGVGI